MKLSRIELSGFKSFADSVTLSFEGGVTAIVGPNGCGKSNVSDAVRWVLGEQSARLLRGGKMEDVIFQGAAGRRPVNVTEVSLYLDNEDGELPIAYQEVVITRRLSRSGQSDYLLNGDNVRLRDIQDLLRGTGLGSDAGVVIEAKMIDLLLSDRADERRSLFEEAAGIGLYRDRKHSTERRLDETALDLQRVEDLIAEVQSQLRSLARQKGKTERHARLTEEKFAVQLTLARRLLDRMTEDAAEMERRHGELTTLLPGEREALHQKEHERARAVEARASREAGRSEIVERLAAARIELGRLDGELNLARERLSHLTERQARASEERTQQEARAAHASEEERAARAERDQSGAEHNQIQGELDLRTRDEESSRGMLAEARNAVRAAEQAMQALVQQLHAHEGERVALEGELGSLRERRSRADALQASLASELIIAQRKRDHFVERSGIDAYEARRAGSDVERLRHRVAGAREAEAACRATRRKAEEALTQLAARRHAIEELERERVGLAPAAAKLLEERQRFDGGVLGVLSDFISTSADDAELAERLLGEWMHAVLVRDEAAVDVVRAWHAHALPGALVLLPQNPGPAQYADAELDARLEVQEPARAWVRAALAGSHALDAGGRVLRRASGAIFLSGAGTPSGPLQRRAELAQLTTRQEQSEAELHAAEEALAEATAGLATAERELAAGVEALQHARDAERSAAAQREDAIRVLSNLTRESGDAEQQLARVAERQSTAEARMAELDAALGDGVRVRAEREATLTSATEAFAGLESAQETTRDARVQSQVREAHVAARHRAAAERVERAEHARVEASGTAARLAEELTTLEAEIARLGEERGRMEEARSAEQTALRELEQEATRAERELAEASAALTQAEQTVESARGAIETWSEEHHGLELRHSELQAERRRVTERVEAEWKKPLDRLLEGFTLLDLELPALEEENSRIVEALESIGPVNPLAMEEHAEEQKRLEFLVTQRDDLVAARQSLLQAIREIDGTARELFLRTFEAVQQHFQHVFMTLFGGGECELRLTNPDEPLESEIEIHAAPRGKRTQRIHLLSSGERTLVAVSLLFSIYLTKPSPFCLMDEVDAPLDDSNVGRFTRLLEEFKQDTQFIVITHNPRTMQSADAVYGVTMQEPGVSTIVGVRLGEHAA
ncbi:MAG TPA: chromosome segregation protein SMC [Gemmatimonadales bacterium]|nr:chromosome segregation protein SMC [Gemmatimonadales bacterium]